MSRNNRYSLLDLHHIHVTFPENYPNTVWVVEAIMWNERGHLHWGKETWSHFLRILLSPECLWGWEDYGKYWESLSVQVRLLGAGSFEEQVLCLMLKCDIRKLVDRLCILFPV